MPQITYADLRSGTDGPTPESAEALSAWTSEALLQAVGVAPPVSGTPAFDGERRLLSYYDPPEVA
jgi:hypothetical protein